MKADKNLPAIQTNDDDLTIQEKREHYKKEVEKYEAELLNNLNAFKRDATRLVLIAGTAFVAYKITKYLLKKPTESKPDTPQIQQSTNQPAYKQNGHISTHKETSMPKKTFSIMSLIKQKMTNMALDILKTRLQEEIIKYNKKNAK